MICLVIPALHAGGMERVMAELAGYFCSKEKYEVHMILYGIKREVFYQIPNNLVVHKPDFKFNNSLRLFSALKTIRFLRKKLRELNPNSVLSFGERWNNFVLLSTIGLKLPVFVSDRSQPDKSLGFVQDRLRNLLYPRTAGVICQTATAQGIYSKMFSHSNFIVIGNPIRSISPTEAIARENIILSVGRLITTKHYDELIRIFAELNPADWQLIIIGGDAQKQSNMEKLKSLISELGVDDKVKLCGTRLDVDHFYNRAKIFAFTSSSEGFPNVIGEAMSAGLPVVAYNCIAGPSDLIEHENTGYLVDTHDMKSFKRHLEALIREVETRELMGSRAKERVKQFSISEIGKKFEQSILVASSAN